MKPKTPNAGTVDLSVILDDALIVIANELAKLKACAVLPGSFGIPESTRLRDLVQLSCLINRERRADRQLERFEDLDNDSMKELAEEAQRYLKQLD